MEAVRNWEAVLDDLYYIMKILFSGLPCLVTGYEMSAHCICIYGMDRIALMICFGYVFWFSFAFRQINHSPHVAFNLVLLKSDC